MADLSDVEVTLALMATQALYPNGTSQPSVANVTVTVARGWPEPLQLNPILAAGNAMFTVFPMPGMDANTTRFLAQMEQVYDSLPVAELTLSVSANRITVGGAILAGEAASVNFNYQAFSYGVKSNDTFATVAAGVAALIPGAVASGAIITLSNAFNIEVAVSVPVQMQEETARQTRQFMLTAWCPTPEIRDLMVPPVDKLLKLNKRFLLPDNTLARLIYRGSLETDQLAKQNVYRRDLHYEVEYVTTNTEVDNTVTNFAVGITPNSGITSTINI